MTVTSWFLLRSSRARFHPTFPAPQTMTYMLGPSALRQGRPPQQLDRGLRRADGLQALLGVPGRPARVEHAGHDLRDVEALLRDLRDHQVRVVPVGGGDEHVGAV